MGSLLESDYLQSQAVAMTSDAKGTVTMYEADQETEEQSEKQTSSSNGPITDIADTIVSDLNLLESAIDRNSKDNNELQKEHDQLQRKFDKLKKDHTVLVETVTSLETKVTELSLPPLQERLADAEEAVKIFENMP